MLRAFCPRRLPAHCHRDSTWDISEVRLVLFCVLVAAPLHVVLPLQHVPVLLEMLDKDLKGLPEQFQSGADLVIDLPLWYFSLGIYFCLDEQASCCCFPDQIKQPSVAVIYWTELTGQFPLLILRSWCKASSSWQQIGKSIKKKKRKPWSLREGEGQGEVILVGLQAGNNQPHDLGSPSLLMNDNWVNHLPLMGFKREGQQGATDAVGIPKPPIYSLPAGNQCPNAL